MCIALLEGNLLHMYVPDRCPTRPVALLDAGYATGHPVALPEVRLYNGPVQLSLALVLAPSPSPSPYPASLASSAHTSRAALLIAFSSRACYGTYIYIVFQARNIYIYI